MTTLEKLDELITKGAYTYIDGEKVTAESIKNGFLAGIFSEVFIEENII